MGLFSSDDSLKDVLSSISKNRGLYSAIDLPKYKEFTPEKYDNESFNYHLTSDDPVVRSKQLEALAQMKGLSSEGLSDADVASFQKAREMGDQMARAKTEAVLQDAQARGVAGGGLEFALREAGNQNAAQRAQDAALQEAAARSNQRGQYLQAYASGLGGMRQQDYNTNAANTNIINRFNAMNTSAANQAHNANVDNTNQALMYNQGLKDKNYANQMQRADRIAGINTQEGNAYAAQAEANRQRRSALGGAIMTGVGAWAGNELYQDNPNLTSEQNASRRQQNASMWGGIGGGLGSSIF